MIVQIDGTEFIVRIQFLQMKKFSTTFLVVFFLFQFFSLQGYCQFENIRFEHYTAANGLSTNNTNAIFQDKRGFIWIGSSHGLNRYDGKNFKKYTTIGDNGLTDLNIRCLAEDTDGNIWIGTQNGLNKLNPETEVIQQFYMGDGPGTIPYKWCNNLFIDKDNLLWLSTEKGIASYDKLTESFHNYPVSVYGDEAGINKFISDFLEDSKGRFWLTSSYGIKLFDKSTKTAKTFLFGQNTGTKAITYPVMTITEDSDGIIWAGTWMGGLLKFDEQKMEFLTEDIPKIPFNTLVVSDITQIKLKEVNYLMLATDHGLVLINKEDLEKTGFAQPDDDLENFCFDHQGNLWITGYQGLYKLNQNSLAFQWINLPENNGKTQVFHIIPDIRQAENIFYLSTLGAWWQFDKRNLHITPKPLPADKNNLLTRINDWYADKTGYWFTSVNGFGFYDPEKNKLIDLSYLTDNHSSYRYTHYIINDVNNTLFISLHRSGIMLLDKESLATRMLFADKTKPDNILGRDINDMVAARDGNIFFTANDKMYQLSVDDLSHKTIAAPDFGSKIDKELISPDNLCFTPDNKLFVSSNLQIFEYHKQQLVKKFPEKDYADFYIYQMKCNFDGNFWITTSKGIYKTDTSFKQWVNINNHLSLSDNEHITDISFCKDGSILFASEGKIGILTDSLLQTSTKPPTVMISHIKHGDSEVFMLSQANQQIDLNYKEPLEIELATLNYCYEKEVKLFYQLRGWKDDVYELKDQSKITYQQLPPGKYEFKTWQQNAEGIESQKTSISFIIHPPFYQTWWFVLLNILVFGATIYLINRYKMKKALELERLRTRIATDLHDDIGATLSAISIYSEALKSQIDNKQPFVMNILSKMGENSREMVTNMSDIVWAINPENDHGEKLINRMHNYASDLCPAKDIHLHFYADEKLNQMRLPLEHRKNIYLIFKESMNNAVKYSGAGNIRVHIQSEGKNIRLSVQDDGKGFDLSKISHGNGLKNIHSRAGLLGAEVKISSEEAKGTHILLIWNR